MVESARKEHWDQVYSSRSEHDVSWYQPEPRLSLELIRAYAPAESGRIIDVGGGASTLVDRLLERSFARLAVLDLSDVALSRSIQRLGELARKVEWITADITKVEDIGTFDVWHDRAVFHFLTSPEDRKSYVELARRTIPSGGSLVIGTFADDGPSRCSDLDVRRYNARTLSAELGKDFSLVKETGETHTTPWRKAQSFFFGVFERR
jgi:SAM-dependent methyltransferase